MTLTVQHILLANADDQDGALVFDGDLLVAVLSRLSAEHEEKAGRWFLECGFGVGLDRREDFADLQTACDWIADRIGERDRDAAEALARRPR